MPRAKTTKLYRTFVKGLITEASPLTYPENASIDEDNCVIFRKGNRSRRLGIDYEDSYTLSSYSLTESTFNNNAIIEYKWEAVGNQTGTAFLCSQIGTVIRFYDINTASAVSLGLKSFTIDLNSFKAPAAGDISSYPVSMSSGNGVLFVVGEGIEPFYVEYDLDTDTITTTQIYVQIRDFKGVHDNLANDEEPTTLTAAHQYNLLNQGWFDPRNTGASGVTISYFDPYGELNTQEAPTQTNISLYYAAYFKYPSNSKQWFAGKNTTGDFDPATLAKFSPGSSHAPRGHFVVNAFYIDRSAMSGVLGLDVESTVARPISVAFVGGRAWYGCESKVYFSQVLDEVHKAGFCYQDADPTSEDISDLIASDGGVIPIPEIGKIIKLVPMGSGVLVFANNGLWFVSGTSAGFTATDYSVQKISSIGTESPMSIVDTEGQVFWWSKVGIQGISQKQGLFGTVDGAFDKQNIAEQTIQTFYNDDIDETAKIYAKGIYDPATNVVQWLYRDNTVSGNYRYNRILNLDLTLQAFYPWSLSYISTKPFITGVFTTTQVNSVKTDQNVVTNSVLVVAGGVQVTAGDYSSQIRPTFLKYVTAVPNPTDYKITFSYFQGLDFADFKTFDGTGTAYESFVETGYELLEDTMRKKQAPYVFCYFRRTEENATVEVDGSVSLDKPSSCMFQVRWDWTDSTNSGKWTTPIEAYRTVRFYPVSVSGPYENGYPVVVTKNKVRGTGRAIQFRFSSSTVGKDFDLLGWAVSYTGGATV